METTEADYRAALLRHHGASRKTIKNAYPQAKRHKKLQGAALERARDVIDLYASEAQLRSEKIISVVCLLSDITPGQLKSSLRTRHFCHWRHIAHWLLREHLSLSFPQVGRMMGGKDHSTIIHSVNVVNGNSDLFAADIAAVEALL